MRWQVRVRAADARSDTTPDGHAVAVWRPPHFDERASTLLRAAPLLGPVLRRCTLTEIRRALDDAMTRWQERRHQLLPHPHWYPEAVAVAPAWQRLGLGPILVRHGLQRADRTRPPVILGTNRPTNARLWGTAGFDLLEYTCPEDEPLHIPVWRMIHHPPTP